MGLIDGYKEILKVMEVSLHGMQSSKFLKNSPFAQPGLDAPRQPQAHR